MLIPNIKKVTQQAQFPIGARLIDGHFQCYRYLKDNLGYHWIYEELCKHLPIREIKRGGRFSLPP